MSALAGEAALVTGGSRGIGRAICQRLAADGATVGVNYRHSETAAREVVDEIVAAGGSAFLVQGDVSSYDEAQAVIDKVVAETGGIDILVNNAGITRNLLVANMTPADWQEVMGVNFGGVFNCTNAVAPAMQAKGRGAIVNVSSVMGERGWLGASSYAASKAAINAFTRSCAVEFGRFGVRVNAVLPGFVDTDLVADLMVTDGGRSIRSQLPTRSFTTVDEIAALVAFLAGPQTKHLTGSLIPVDGAGSAALLLGRPNPAGSRR